MRLIDADAIKLTKGFFEEVDNVPKFYEWLHEQPTIDPVKHGKWIEYPIADGMNQCSVCGVLRFGDSNYCPNCGAEMERSEDAAN